MSGAPECNRDEIPEIEITPAMIEAGVAVLCAFETETADEAYWAKRVYLAMVALAPASARSTKQRADNDPARAQ
jgi:hypothetical protein